MYFRQFSTLRYLLKYEKLHDLNMDKIMVIQADLLFSNVCDVVGQG